MIGICTYASRTGALLAIFLAATTISVTGPAYANPTTSPGAPQASAADRDSRTPVASTVVTIPADIPLKRDSGGDEAASTRDSLVWVGVLLVVVVAGLPLMRSVFRRIPTGRRSPMVERWLGRRGANEVCLLESIRLTERHSVHVIAWQRKRLLLACCEQAVTVIDSTVEIAPDAASGDTPEAGNVA